MKRIFTSLALGALLLIGSARADLIQWGAVGSTTPLHQFNTSPLPSGNLLYVGQFPAGFNFSANQTLNSLLTAFTILDSGFVGQDQSGGPALGDGSFFGRAAGNPIDGTNAFSGAPASGVPGQALFMWVFNAATPQGATQWGIVTNSAANWSLQQGVAGQNNFDLSDTGTSVPVGALGTLIFNAGDGANELFLGTAVPEPSTYLIGLAGLGTMAFMRRRRK